MTKWKQGIHNIACADPAWAIDRIWNVDGLTNSTCKNARLNRRWGWRSRSQYVFGIDWPYYIMQCKFLDTWGHVWWPPLLIVGHFSCLKNGSCISFLPLSDWFEICSLREREHHWFLIWIKTKSPQIYFEVSLCPNLFSMCQNSWQRLYQYYI